METRQIQTTEYKVYCLVASDVRGAVDNYVMIIGSTDKQKLEEFYLNEKEPWKDDNKTIDFYGRKHGYMKTFKKGSVLEWFNDVKFEWEWVQDLTNVPVELI